MRLIQANGSRKTLNLPVVDPNRKTAYWLPRKAFVFLLYQEIERNWQDYINVIFKTKCLQINEIVNNQGEKKLEVLAQSEQFGNLRFAPHLLVGTDGINSVVRNTLKEWEKSTPDRFEMKLFPSPSSNLRYKVLTLPPKFPLDNSGKEFAVSEMAYAIRGAFRGRRRSVSLGLLPLKNPDEPRSANIITQLDHEIWQLKNSEELYNFLEKAFAQLPIGQIVSQEEADRFAKSAGGYFPIPQYCSGLYFLFPQEQTDNSPGVVLLGDAIHCFPPDIGQGVNSALEDVYVFHEALAQSDDDVSRALPLYESLREADVKALVRLAQTAYPWQYNQDSFRKWLWDINFFFRFILSRVLPYLFSPPAFFMIQNHQLSYKEILLRANRTTRNLYVISLMILCGVLALYLEFVIRNS